MPRIPINVAEVKASAARLFATRDGQQVLGYLTRKYYDAPMTKINLEREVGRRDVLLHIKQLIEDTNEKLS